MRLARWLYGPSPALLGLTLAAVVILMLAAILPHLARVELTPRGAPPVITTAAPAADAAHAAMEGNIGGGAQGCPPSVVRGTARVDICWQAYRILNEEDQGDDYYVIEVTAIASGGSDGMQWAVLRSHPVTGSPPFSAEDSVDLGSGVCQTIVPGSESFAGFGGALGARRAVLACERWRIGSTSDDNAETDLQTDWSCGCLFPVNGDRDISLIQTVSVRSGVVPSWQLGADVGR